MKSNAPGPDIAPALAPSLTWRLERFARLLRFATASRMSDGFGWLTESGQVRPVPTTTLLTARYTHVFSVGDLAGIGDYGALAEHGVARLSSGPLRDSVGWQWDASSEATAKQSYLLAQVILAASSASIAGIPGAGELLDDALGILDESAWDDPEGVVRDTYGFPGTAPDYRGANSNMHAAEGLLAAADALGSEDRADQARRIIDRFVGRIAAAHDWLMPEHFDSSWRVLKDFGRNHRSDEFKPYGVTPGHLFEWARICLNARPGAEPATADALHDWARNLARRGHEVGWRAAGDSGVVYTTTFTGRPVVTRRLHWPLTEAIAATAHLAELQPGEVWDWRLGLYWEDARRDYVEEAGTWAHERGPHPERMTMGRPDAYHVAGAYLSGAADPHRCLAGAARTFAARANGVEDA
ncbi:AGE family epimerase/isomerase [Microbacterium sp. SLBN-154]|uniref:AGE family epimerase/isomerase n=1 Tax=Microbacterium sp. SLBN-154 TaxID=2768458 RepID=UPI00114EDE1F|nr:AGE family epimerase/isomerase [Microbacterium sp. SLBN-154]